MSLYKRGKRWWAYFYIDGLRHQASTGTSNRRVAERIAQQLHDELVQRQHQLPIADPNMTFDALAARFIANAGAQPHHLLRLKHLLPYFGDAPLRAITKVMVREYRESRHRSKCLTEATINREVAVLRHLLYWGVDEGYLSQNPLARIRLLPERRLPRPVVTLSEEDLLLVHAPRHLRELITVALDTGMRRGELLRQRWDQIDMGRGVLQVTRSKTLQGEGREIPLTHRVHAVLEGRRQHSGLVFLYRGHDIKSPKRAWRHASRHLSRHVRFHDLRHTFNTRLLEAGVLQEVRKALMGHSSGRETNAVYTHIELPLKRDAIARLERWLAEQRARLVSDTRPTPTQTPNNQED